MDNQPLHPNLARLAAAYDDILRRYSVRQIDAATARLEMLALQARDDEGIVWTLDPDNGDWKRRTRTGAWVFADPPRSGVATLTAHDLSRDPRLFNPDSRVRFEQAPVVPHGLHGSVRGRVGQASAPHTPPRRSRARAVAALLTAGVLCWGGAQLLPDDTPASDCIDCLAD